MNKKRMIGVVAVMVLSFSVGGQAVAKEESGWLVKQKNASPNGQWILREDGTTELQPIPTGWMVREGVSTQSEPIPSGWIPRERGSTKSQPVPTGWRKKTDGTQLPPGFERGKKEGWNKERPRTPAVRQPGAGRPGYGHLDTRTFGSPTPRKPLDYVDTRTYGTGVERKPPGFVDQRVYGDGRRRTPPGFVDTRTYGGGRPGLGRQINHDRGKHKGLEQGRRVGPPNAKPVGGRKVGPRAGSR